MLSSKVFEDMTNKLQDLVNSGPAKDMERNLHALLMQGISKMELVGREEFEVQSQVLARTREQLQALEARVAELEAAHKAAE